MKPKIKYQVQKKTRGGEWQNWYLPKKNKALARRLIKTKKHLKTSTVRILPIEKGRKKEKRRSPQRIIIRR